MVGLTEHFGLTLRVLERTLPRFFTGAAAAYASDPTFRAEAAFYSDPTRPFGGRDADDDGLEDVRALLARDPAFRAEASFYAAATRTFAARAVAALGEEHVPAELLAVL